MLGVLLLLLLLPAAALGAGTDGGASGAVSDGLDNDIRKDISHGLQIIPAARRVAAEDVDAGILRRPDELRIGMGILPVPAPGQVAVLLHEAKVDEADAAGSDADADADADDLLAFRLAFGFFWDRPEPSGASMKLSALTSTKRRRMAWKASRWEMSVVAMGPRSMAVGLLVDRPFLANAAVTRRGTTSVRGASIFSMHR